jgi:hypothetical protein
MFSFSKKSSPTTTDKVWKTKSGCHKGLATAGLQALTHSQTPIVFSFFQDEQDRFAAFLFTNRVTYFVMASGNSSEAPQQGSVFLMDAFSIESADAIDFLVRRSKASPLAIFFLGHYPLPAPENKVLEKLIPHVGSNPIVFYLSLEDALLQTFGSDRIRPLMETMGMANDECIEHQMVSKAISRAREKIGVQVEYESKAKTEASWFEKNIKT